MPFEPEYESRLSYRPPTVKDRNTARIVGVLLLIVAAFIVVGGFFMESQSEPIRAQGTSATGVLESFKYVENEGYYPELRFFDAAGEPHMAVGREPMFTQSARLLEQEYKVYYTAGQPPATFIEGMDPTMPLWPFFVGAGVVGLIGLFFVLKPKR